MKDLKTPEKNGLDQFTRDVLYNVLVGVTAKALGWAALLLGALLVALVVTGWEVPAWTLVALAFFSLVLVYLTRRVTGREARELRARVEGAEDQLDRHDSYGSNLCSVLDTFQKINAKDIDGMTMRSFIERGILTPARDVMRENGHPHDLRMSVLLVSEGNFSMIWAAGHNIESQRKYRVPIEKTISKVAYEKQVIQVWKNAPREERSFVPNPKATRGFKSMVSIPILMGEETRGVFNIVTDLEDAFDRRISTTSRLSARSSNWRSAWLCRNLTQRRRNPWGRPRRSPRQWPQCHDGLRRLSRRRRRTEI